MNPRTCWGDMEKRKFLTLPELERRPLGRPAHSQSLHRLRYPGPLYCFSINSKSEQTRGPYPDFRATGGQF
jgi:hypothetical protein